MSLETNVHDDVKEEMDQNQQRGTAAQQGIDHGHSGFAKDHVSEVAEKLENAKEAVKEAGDLLRDAAADTFAGVKQGFIGTAKEVRSKATDVADVVKKKYRRLSEALSSVHSSVDVDGGDGSSVEGGKQVEATGTQLSEVKTTEDVDSNVAYQRSKKNTDGAACITGHEMDNLLKRGTEKMDELLGEGIKRGNDLVEKGVEKIDEFVQEGARKVNDVRQKGSETIEEIRDYTGSKLQEMGSNIKP